MHEKYPCLKKKKRKTEQQAQSGQEVVRFHLEKVRTGSPAQGALVLEPDQLRGEGALCSTCRLPMAPLSSPQLHAEAGTGVQSTEEGMGRTGAGLRTNPASSSLQLGFILLEGSSRGAGPCTEP